MVMDKKCSMHWRDQEYTQGFGGKTTRKEAIRKPRDVGGRIKLICIFEEQVSVVWPGFIWFRIDTSGTLMYTP
jgi:hypothetical protein